MHKFPPFHAKLITLNRKWIRQLAVAFQTLWQSVFCNNTLISKKKMIYALAWAIFNALHILYTSHFQSPSCKLTDWLLKFIYLLLKSKLQTFIIIQSNIFKKSQKLSLFSLKKPHKKTPGNIVLLVAHTVRKQRFEATSY